MQAAREFPLRTRERMTFEYVLIEGVNDAPEQAREVVELVRGMRARINLIALNPGTELPYRTPDRSGWWRSGKYWWTAGILAFVRRPRGRDIFAACGQLKRTVGAVPRFSVETRLAASLKLLGTAAGRGPVGSGQRGAVRGIARDPQFHPESGFAGS